MRYLQAHSSDSLTRKNDCLKYKLSGEVNVSGDVICVVHLTNQCNLRCVYCYKNVTQGDSQEESGNLSWEDLTLFADWVLASSKDFILFQFHGGEPTLRWSMIICFVEWIYGHPYYTCERVGFGIQTNGIDFDQEKLDWATANSIRIGVSFDGISAIQNANRPLAGGQESYLHVVENVARMVKTKTKTCIQTTVLDYGNLSECFWHSVELGVKRVVLSPAYYPSTLNNKYWCSALASAHLDLARELIERNLKKPTAIEVTLARLLRNWFTPEWKNKFMCHAWPCGAGTRLIALKVNGCLYPCDELFAFEEWCYGHVTSLSSEPFDHLLTNSTINRKLHSRHYELIEDCRNCAVRAACGGGCSGIIWSRCGTLLASDPLCTYYQTLLAGLLDLIELEPLGIPMLSNPWLISGERR